MSREAGGAWERKGRSWGGRRGTPFKSLQNCYVFHSLVYCTALEIKKIEENGRESLSKEEEEVEKEFNRI